MPEAFDFTSTLVMGWTLPVATTDRAMSPRSTLASCEGSILAPFPRAATAMPRKMAITTTTTPAHTQSLRFRLRSFATHHSRGRTCCVRYAVT